MKLVWGEGSALQISLESSFLKTRSHFVSHGSLKLLSSNNPPALVSHVNVNRYGFCSLDISILQYIKQKCTKHLMEKITLLNGIFTVNSVRVSFPKRI